MNKEILAFEEFANTKESLLTAQSESLAAEMKDLEKEMEEKLKVLEDQFQTKLKEEQNLRSELLQRKGNTNLVGYFDPLAVISIMEEIICRTMRICQKHPVGGASILRWKVINS